MRELNSPSVLRTETSARSSIVRGDNLTVGYGSNTIWRDATFEIGKGEFVAIIGPNGAGKTTLFRLLLGLHQPDSGSIDVFNARPKRGNPRIGYVPQNHMIDN